MVYDKWWYKSKTVWFAVIGVVTAVLDAMFGSGNTWTALVVAAAGILVGYGRTKAEGPIKWHS